MVLRCLDCDNKQAPIRLSRPENEAKPLVNWPKKRVIRSPDATDHGKKMPTYKHLVSKEGAKLVRDILDRHIAPKQLAQCTVSAMPRGGAGSTQKISIEIRKEIYEQPAQLESIMIDKSFKTRVNQIISNYIFNLKKNFYK
jgi:hypothetical protein